MVLIFAPVKADVMSIRARGIKLIVIRKSIFLFFIKFFLNLILIFFKITLIIIKKGIKINICLHIKIRGFSKWFIKSNSDKPDLLIP